MMYKRNKNIFL